MPPEKDCNSFDKGRLTERVSNNSRAIEELKEGQQRMWEVIDKLRNRLPNWAVMVIGILLAMLGWCAKAII